MDGIRSGFFDRTKQTYQFSLGPDWHQGLELHRHSFCLLNGRYSIGFLWQDKTNIPVFFGSVLTTGAGASSPLFWSPKWTVLDRVSLTGQNKHTGFLWARIDYRGLPFFANRFCIFGCLCADFKKIIILRPFSTESIWIITHRNKQQQWVAPTTFSKACLL